MFVPVEQARVGPRRRRENPQVCTTIAEFCHVVVPVGVPCTQTGHYIYIYVRDKAGEIEGTSKNL